MHSIANKLPAVVTLLLLIIAGTPSYASADQPSGGVTITPANLRLELAKGSTIASGSFAVTNHYNSSVTLAFSFAKSQQDPGGPSPIAALSVAQPQITLAPEASATQTYTIKDSASMQPGSQLADLVIAQHSTASSGIGVSPAIRLPLSIVKDDGAVTSLGLTSIGGAHPTITMPQHITVSLRNTGNMVAIPHGTVNIAAPNGTIVGKGVVNDSSKAVLPGRTLTSDVAIAKLASAVVPGAYIVRVSYSLGGDTTATVATKSFIFAAWWNIGAAIVLAALAWLAAKNYHILAAKFKRAKPPRPIHPRRQLLIGRDIT